MYVRRLILTSRAVALTTGWHDLDSGWNTKISARETNYGTRIDYVLVTPGVLPWIKAGDIQPSIKGSDHCPVFVDLHEEITTDTGERRVLRDLMHMGVNDAKREPPRLAAKHWPEFQGKQTLMSSFFTKRVTETSPLPTAAPPNGHSTLATAFGALETQPPLPIGEPPASNASQPPSASSQPDTEISAPPSPVTVSPAPSQASLKPSQEPRESRKRPRTDTSTSGTVKQKKLEVGQTKLSSFFTKPPPPTTPTPTTAPTKAPSSSWCPSPEIIDLCEDSEELPSSLPTITSDIRLPAENNASSSSGQSKENEKNGKTGPASWSALFTPIPPPLCSVHREPAKEFRVNKPGPNKGKTFFLCSRPVGPGYDKGRSERLREEVDHRYKCNFFMWSKDAKRAAPATTGGGAAGIGTTS
jgi:AP endonuclease-2